MNGHGKALLTCHHFPLPTWNESQALSLELSAAVHAAATISTGMRSQAGAPIDKSITSGALSSNSVVIERRKSCRLSLQWKL